MTARTVLDIYEEALGWTPSQIISTSRQLKSADLAAILAAQHRAAEVAREQPTRVATEIWPLASHHTYDARAIFGTQRADILPRTLTLLLVHDGLVIADPLQTVHQILVSTTEEAAVAALNQATRELAQVEGLIAAGALRLTSARPSLQEENRQAVLVAMGLDPELSIFTNLLEVIGTDLDFLEAATVALPGSLKQKISLEAQHLYRLFGVTIARPGNLTAAERRIRDLAACVIEVSWQFAVAAEDSSCDMAFKGPLEQHLARELVATGFAHDMGPGRHVETVDLGRVPNLDPTRLTIADALAARQDDSFASFRTTVRLALDELDKAHRMGVDRVVATATFKETMQEESRRLLMSARKATFRDRVKDTAVSASLGVVTELAVAPIGAVPAAVAAATTSITTLLWEWLRGRQEKQDQGACVRYLSMLG